MAILRRALRLSKVRRALRGTVTACLGCGALAVALRHAGESLPPLAWSAVAPGAVVGWLWPVRAERELLAFGRAVGLGERLASLHALANRPASGVTTLLASEVGGRRWALRRLAAGRWEIGALAVGALLVSSLWLPVGHGPSGPEIAVTQEEATPLPEDDDHEEHSSRPADADVPPQMAGQGTAQYTPYTDLLAAVLGVGDAEELASDPEGLARALAEQQGLLREIAERLEQLAAPGAAAETATQVAELATEVARGDLRHVLERAARSSDEESVAEAQQAVDAALRAQDDLAKAHDAVQLTPTEGDYGDSEMPPDGVERRSAAPEGEVSADSAGVEHGLGDLPNGTLDLDDLNGVLGERPTGEGYAPDDVPRQERGGPPGAAYTGPPEEGDFAEPEMGQADAAVPVAVRTADGTWRAYLVVDVPGESPGGRGEAVELSPQQVDLLLRSRSVPPELRDVVRRYFEQLSVEAGGEQ